MGCSVLLTLVLVLGVADCSEVPGGEPMVEVIQNVTAFLGEDVILSCRYLGEESDIQSAVWKRQLSSRSTFKRLAGFSNGRPFGRNGFSEPASVANLTVVTNVSSVDVEGEYTCQFVGEEDDYSHSVFITVVAQPEILIQVSAETVNDVHYQSVQCAAVAGRPQAQISWLVKGVPASGYPFAVDASDAESHSNGTSTVSSILRFPTHLQDEDSVTCVVQHPTFPRPKLTTVMVETYTRPNVTITAEMVQRGGSDFWVVSCISSGGRPATDISLDLDTDEDLQMEANTNSHTQTSSVLLPAVAYQGQNVTCVFDHPKFTHDVQHVMTLPSFYLSGVQLWSSDPGVGSDFQGNESVELQEGQGDAVIGLRVTGSVPRYNVSCERDDGLLPEGVEVTGSSITVRGPVGPQHGGVYECLVSYHHIRATLQFNITVRPHITQPIPPTIAVDLRTEDGRGMIECSAADAVPAANMSWLLPEGVSGASWFNFTSHNGSHSVRGVLLLPACSPRELTALCVINHPAFEGPRNRSITLPICAPPNIAIHSLTEWEEGEEYQNVECSVDSVAPAAAISWHVGNSNRSIPHVSDVKELGDGLVSVRSSVHLLSPLYSGQDLTCVVEHPSLKAPEKRTTRIPAQKAHLLSVYVERKPDSPLWLAVCDCTGASAGTNLAWVLPENARSQTSMHSEYEGHVLRARLTYQFNLALHEGQNLTCVYHYGHGSREEKSIPIPRYYISSVRVANHTTPLHSRYDRQPITHRLTLQENLRNQRVLLQVEGNVPEYNLSCKRSDGTFIPLEESAMVFEWEITKRDAGLYSCQASFYHHAATVSFLAEVMSEEKLFGMVVMVCISSGSAVIIVLVIVAWVCWLGKRKRQYKEQEYLSALTVMMQEPGSPEVKKPPVTEGDSPELTHLFSYSIVLDVKTSV